MCHRNGRQLPPLGGQSCSPGKCTPPRNRPVHSPTGTCDLWHYQHMTFRKDANVTGGRRATTGGSGGRIAAGGGIGSLLLIGLFLLMGGNPSDIGGMLGGGQSGGGPESTLEHCNTPEDGNQHADCR